MRTVRRFLLGVPVTVLLVGMLIGTASAAAPQPYRQARGAVTAAATVLIAAPASPTSADAPAGPNIKRQQQQADENMTHRKWAMGIACAVLLVIVFFGHRQRNKSRIRKKNLQNAKG